MEMGMEVNKWIGEWVNKFVLNFVFYYAFIKRIKHKKLLKYSHHFRPNDNSL